MNTMTATLLTAQQLGGSKLHYSPRHINEYLKDRIFIEGIHYIRLPGSRRIFYVWETIQRDFVTAETGVLMANGGVCNG